MEGEGARPVSLEKRRDSRRRLWYFLLTAVYVAAAAALVCLSRNAVNPDGISYIQAARHYAAGRMDLAVNGWFGPMLSWLLVPCCWLGCDLALAYRVMIALAGLVFATGVVRLTGRLGGAALAPAAYAVALVLSLRTVFAELTPDFVQAAGLAWYFAMSADLLAPVPSRKKAILAGLVAGACFLVKAYTFWFVILQLLLTLIVRAVLVRTRRPAEKPEVAAQGRQPSQAGWALLPFVLTAGTMALVCAPWIAVISIQDGRLTTNTPATRAMRSWPSKGWPADEVPFYGELPRFGVPSPEVAAAGWGYWNGLYPHFALQRPREGRLTVWENPVEANGVWPSWAPPGEPHFVDKQIKVVEFNIGRTVGFIRAWDGLLALPIAALLAAAIALFRRRLRAQRALWVWAALSAGAYMGGYLILFLYERFTWGCWAPLIAVAVSLIANIWRGQGDPASGSDSQRPRPPSAGKKEKKKEALPPIASRGALAVILMAVVFGSIGYPLVERIQDEVSNPGSESAMGTWIRQAADAFPQKGRGVAISSNDWAKGLYFSYWSDSVFLGEYPPKYSLSPAETDALGRDISKPLRPFRPLAALFFEPPPDTSTPRLVDFLKESQGFRPVGESYDPRSHWRVVELGFQADGNRP